MKVIFRLGRGYLGRKKTLVILYIFGYFLCQTLIPLGISLTAGSLTEYFKATFAPPEVHTTGALPPNTPQPEESRDHAPQDSRSALTSHQLLTSYGFWLILTLVLVGASFGHKYVSATLAGGVSNDIRKDLFASLLSRPSGFFHQHDSDQLTLIVNQFSLQVQMALQSLLIDPVLNLVGMLVLGATLYTKLLRGAHENGAQIWIFFSAIALVALASPWIVTLMGRKLQQSSKDFQQQMLLIQSLVGGALKAPEEIQAMRAESIFDRKHAGALELSLQRRLRQTVAVETINIANRLPGDIVLISLLGLAVFITVSGLHAISGGIVIILFTLTPQFMGAVQGLSAFSINASMNWPAVATVDEMLSSGTEIERAPESKEEEQLEPTLEARNITFAYPGVAQPVLDNVSFTVPARQITGFIAKAGQGKTTFFRLALRFYEPQHGQILLGGRPHTLIPLNTLRQKMVLMHQTPAFFHDTVRENFLIAQPEATDEQIRALCGKTRLWNILENSYGQNPLDRPFVAGNFLSGGQRKLFALTRCLLRNPTILLLDEPTTGIDPEEKFELVSTMRDACAGRTVLAVDHDIVGWQVLFCDYFIVLNEAKIEQQGTPGELLSQPGLFKNLFEKQAEGFHKMSAVIRQIEVANATDSPAGDPKKYLAS